VILDRDGLAAFAIAGLPVFLLSGITAPLRLFAFASDLSEKRFPLFGLML
jgi:hypothetical protein